MTELLEDDVVDRTLRPDGFDEFVGQDEAKRMLQTYVAAARIEDRPMEHVLLTGSPGSGKTTLAMVVAEALGDPYTVVQRPLNPGQLLAVLYDLKAGVLILDEIHMWSRAQKDALLSLLHDGILETRWGAEEFDWLTVVMLTTDAEKVPPALSSRAEIEPFFEEYTVEEMAGIVDGMARKLGVPLAAETSAALGRAANGGPRNARHLVKAARALFVEGGGERPPTAAEILRFRQVDEDGLGRKHTEYLRLLQTTGGQAGLDVMASRLRVHRTVVKEVERLLLDRQLIAYGPSGRVLTMAGRRRLEGDEPKYSRRTA